MKEQKEIFVAPEAEVIRFEKEDVITTSGGSGGSISDWVGKEW